MQHLIEYNRSYNGIEVGLYRYIDIFYGLVTIKEHRINDEFGAEIRL